RRATYPQPVRPLAAASRHGERCAARADAGAFALEIGALGERVVAVAAAPRKRAAGAGVTVGRHVGAHRHRVGLVVHEAVAHAQIALGHDAIALPYQAAGALDRLRAQDADAVDAAVAGEHGVDPGHGARVAVAAERGDLALADFPAVLEIAGLRRGLERAPERRRGVGGD